MRQIKLDKGKALVDLSKFFYPKQVLNLALKEFKEIADISIEEKENRLFLKIAPKKGNKAEETALQFCNFALSLRQELGEHA